MSTNHNNPAFWKPLNEYPSLDSIEARLKPTAEYVAKLERRLLRCKSRVLYLPAVPEGREARIATLREKIDSQREEHERQIYEYEELVKKNKKLNNEWRRLSHILYDRD